MVNINSKYEVEKMNRFGIVGKQQPSGILKYEKNLCRKYMKSILRKRRTKFEKIKMKIFTFLYKTAIFCKVCSQKFPSFLMKM